MSIDISIEAQRLIDTHNFAITMAGKAFVVRDPSNKKLGRFEGPELLPLLHQAVAAKAGKPVYVVDSLCDLPPDNPPVPDIKPSVKVDPPNKLDTVPVSTKQKVKPEKKPATIIMAPKKASPAPKPEPKPTPEPEDDPDEFEAEELDDTGGKTAKPRHVKRTQMEWTTAKVGMLILKNADKSANELFTMCQEQGIKTKLMTVVGLRRYFQLCIACQIAIMEENV